MKNQLTEQQNSLLEKINRDIARLKSELEDKSNLIDKLLIPINNKDDIIKYEEFLEIKKTIFISTKDDRMETSIIEYSLYKYYDGHEEWIGDTVIDYLPSTQMGFTEFYVFKMWYSSLEDFPEGMEGDYYSEYGEIKIDNTFKDVFPDNDINIDREHLKSKGFIEDTTIFNKFFSSSSNNINFVKNTSLYFEDIFILLKKMDLIQDGVILIGDNSPFPDSSDNTVYTAYMLAKYNLPALKEYVGYTTINERMIESHNNEKVIKLKPVINTYIIYNKYTKLYKIGKTAVLTRRQKQIEVQSGVNLELILVIKEDVEKKLHFDFKDKRALGEWFNLSKNDIKFIKENYYE